MDKQDISAYIDSPKHLLDICKEVIEVLDSQGPSDELREREAQLKEISKTIEKLEKSGIRVPDELRQVKINLISDLSIYQSNNKLLEEFTDSLEEILQDLYKRIGRSSSKELQRKISRVRSREPKTSPETLRQSIIEALVALGGSSHYQKVFDQMEKQLTGKFLPGDLVTRKSGEVAWKNNTAWQRFVMVRDGILKNDSPRGIWELSEVYK